jgi:hypothetical protein
MDALPGFPLGSDVIRAKPRVESDLSHFIYIIRKHEPSNAVAPHCPVARIAGLPRRFLADVLKRTANGLESVYDAALDGEKERSWPGCRAGPGGIPRCSPQLDSGKRLPLQAERDRGIFESVTRKPSCVAILWVASGTEPVFLPRTGTSGLLAVLQLAVCLAGSANFRGRTRLLRRKIRYPFGEHGSASHSGARAWFCRTSTENYLGRKKAQMTFHRSS